MIFPHSFLIFAYLVLLVRFASCFGKLSIKLLHFENQQGRLPNGACCDGLNTGTNTCNGCEYYFIICISGPSGGPCSIKKIRTEELGFSNYFVFDSVFYTASGDEMSNPLKFLFYRWQEVLSLKVSVFDADNGGTADFVTEMGKNLTVPAYSEAHVVKKRLLLLGQPRAGVFPKITMEISVTCNNRYLIPHCTDYCVDKDDDTGHYTCNFKNGTRDCLPGWYGDRCLQRKLTCVPRDDDLGHYSCDPSTGEKICLQGWTDVSSDCTKAIVITSQAPSQKTPESSSKISQSRKQTSIIVLPSATSTKVSSAGIQSSSKIHRQSSSVIPKQSSSKIPQARSSSIMPIPSSSNVQYTHSSKVPQPSSNISKEPQPSSSKVQQLLSTALQEPLRSTHTIIADYRASSITITAASRHHTEKLHSTIAFTVSSTVTMEAGLKQRFTVTFKGNSGKGRNSSASVAEDEICQSLRQHYFYADVPCIFSDSSSVGPPKTSQFVFFKMADQATDVFKMEVTVSDKKIHDKNTKASMEKAIWAAKDRIASKTKLEMAQVVADTNSFPKSSVMIHATGSFTPSSSIYLQDINEESKKKASFDVTRFGGLFVALVVLVILAAAITMVVTRKNKSRRVQPFKQIRTQNANADQIFSSRNSLRSIQSMREVIQKQALPEIKLQDSDYLTLPQTSLTRPPDDLEAAEDNRLLETKFESNVAEVRPNKLNYQDNFRPPPIEYIRKKAVAL